MRYTIEEGSGMKKENTSLRLRRIMAERNLKQVDILRLSEPYCEEYGVKLGRNDLSQYVSGKVEPGQFKLTVLAKALGVSETWLMGYDEPHKEDNVATKTDTFELIGADGTRIELNDREYDAALAVIKAVRKDREKISNGPLDF